MDRIFRIDFFPHEWLTGTSMLTPEERGIYIQIVMLMYVKRGPIQNDAKWIGRVSNCSTRLAAATIQKLVDAEKISIIEGNLLTQKRVETVVYNIKKHAEKSVKAGRKSAELRSENNKNKDLTSTKQQAISNKQVSKKEKQSKKKETKSQKNPKPPTPELTLNEWMEKNKITNLPTEWKTYAHETYQWTPAEIAHVARRFSRFWTSPDCRTPRRRDWYGTWCNWVDKANGTGEFRISAAPHNHRSGRVSHGEVVAFAHEAGRED